MERRVSCWLAPLPLQRANDAGSHDPTFPVVPPHGWLPCGGLFFIVDRLLAETSSGAAARKALERRHGRTTASSRTRCSIGRGHSGPSWGSAEAAPCLPTASPVSSPAGVMCRAFQP